MGYECVYRGHEKIHFNTYVFAQAIIIVYHGNKILCMILHPFKRVESRVYVRDQKTDRARHTEIERRGENTHYFLPMPQQVQLR